MTTGLSEIVGTRASTMSLLVFIVFWSLGFIYKLASSRKGSHAPLYRQITVSGYLRWFFGCWPVTGSLPTFSFVYQISALLELVICTAFNVIWPLTQNFDIIVTVVTAISVFLSLQIAKRIERRQQKGLR